MLPSKISDPTHYKNNLFSLTINQNELDTQITMQLFSYILTTSYLPLTYSLLEKRLPSILRSECFNDLNSPFIEEVKKTEIGHLFEHILLEYLCAVKTSQGVKNASHHGQTKWDWRKDRKGVFHINIDAGVEDKDNFNLALNKSMDLVTEILQSAPHNLSN